MVRICFKRVNGEIRGSLLPQERNAIGQKWRWNRQRLQPQFLRKARETIKVSRCIDDVVVPPATWQGKKSASFSWWAASQPASRHNKYDSNFPNSVSSHQVSFLIFPKSVVVRSRFLFIAISYKTKHQELTPICQSWFAHIKALKELVVTRLFDWRWVGCGWRAASNSGATRFRCEIAHFILLCKYFRTITEFHLIYINVDNCLVSL